MSSRQNPKSYELSITQAQGYVHAVVTGTNSAESNLGYFDELLRECIAKGYRRVLIEERLVGPRLSTTDVFNLASTMSGRASGLFDAVAYVDVNAKSESNAKFGENVAVNRGVRVKAFRTVEEAVQWLRP
jgi:hypothetical protein